MKSEERHKLKSNELEDSIKEIPEYIKVHLNKVIAGVSVTLLLIAGWMWYSNATAGAEAQARQQLQNLTVKSVTLQRDSIIRDPDSEDNSAEGSYNTTLLVAPYGALADEQAGTAVGMTALLQQAEVIRSQLIFSSGPISDDQKAELCQKAELLYQQVINTYPNAESAVAQAQLGLALLSEERGQWDKAKEQYQAIVDNQKFATTVFPTQAKKRLALLDEIKEPIVLAEAAAEEAPKEPDNKN